jgi:hypothetical protein
MSPEEHKVPEQERTEEWHRAEYARLVAQNRARGLGSGPTDVEGIRRDNQERLRRAESEHGPNSPKAQKQRDREARPIWILLAAVAAIMIGLSQCGDGKKIKIDREDLIPYRK